jgi:hypothetical protein
MNIQCYLEISKNLHDLSKAPISNEATATNRMW